LELRDQARALKQDLSMTNITFGNGHCVNTYATTTRDAFKYDAKDALRARGRAAKELQADLRKQHFSIGYDSELNYETDAMASMKCGTITSQRLKEMDDDARAAVDLKHKLLATNVVIGDDPLYFN